MNLLCTMAVASSWADRVLARSLFCGHKLQMHILNYVELKIAGTVIPVKLTKEYK